MECEQAVGAAIQIIASDNFTSRLEQPFQKIQQMRF